jgi:hypothetical protein
MEWRKEDLTGDAKSISGRAQDSLRQEMVYFGYAMARGSTMKSEKKFKGFPMISTFKIF